ncbi:MAG: aminoacyl-tRNA hydrolase [Rickettsia endosymbiont of Bryobia graminum]|nr:aminoacyl-tRNA hydrolase [Rickettsia endosymbiont of Bryobia graminum]
MILIIGLGNIGKEYQSTRHNIGFMTVDYIADSHQLFWNVKSKLRAEVVQGVIANSKILLAKPQIYMNLSGQSVSSLCSYYNIKSNNVIVIHDDIDLETGRIKYKVGGGSGGHNGLKSIDQHIGNNYQRIRIGVGKPMRNDVSDYVLSSFKKDEVQVVGNSIEVINENINLLITGKSEEFKNKISK